jgi:hypothetical protein
MHVDLTNGLGEITTIAHVTLISLGSAPNLAIMQRLYFTINANGDVTAEVLQFTTTCQG